MSLVYDAPKRAFGIVESNHELAAYDLPATGRWPTRVQVDGRHFRHVIETYEANEVLELVAYPERLEIRSERSPFSMPRLDGLGRDPIETRPIPRNPKHKGKVQVPNEPRLGRVELDATWDFSARMPVPQHQVRAAETPLEPAHPPSRQSRRRRSSGMGDLFERSESDPKKTGE